VNVTPGSDCCPARETERTIKEASCFIASS
jgi:hypothetical protein